MHMGLLATDFDTHEPWKWAEELLDDLVPTIANCSMTGLTKIAEAKAKLREPVIAMLAAIRGNERKSYLTFNKDDSAVFAGTYRHYHNLESNDLHFHALDRETKGKVKSSAHWADQYVNKICKIASEIDGSIGSNSMVDEVYRILENWINAMQMCERSHHVTSNNLHRSL